MGERPGFYVRLEVGLSWPRHASKHRSISYGSSTTKHHQREASTSRPQLTVGTSMRPVTNARYRPTDNYLRHIYDYTHAGPQRSQHSHVQQPQRGPRDFAHLSEQPTGHASNERDHRNYLTSPAALTPDRHVGYGPPLAHQPRRSRSMSFSSERQAIVSSYVHDRPWDLDPEPLGSTALPARQQDIKPSPPRNRHPLPPPLGQPDMGNVALPSAWSPPDWAAYAAVETSKRAEAELGSSNGAPAIPSPVMHRGSGEHSRSVDVQSLATALVTVDNGFEDQWWYQGPRAVTIAGDLISPAALQLLYEQEAMTRMAVTSSSTDALPRIHDATPTSTIVELVSPMSDFSSPVTHTMQRTSP